MTTEVIDRHIPIGRYAAESKFIDALNEVCDLKERIIRDRTRFKYNELSRRAVYKYGPVVLTTVIRNANAVTEGVQVSPAIKAILGFSDARNNANEPMHHRAELGVER